MQLAGTCTSQGRLGTPRCHRLHVIVKLAVARHQRCVDTKDTADIKGASTPKMHDVKENAGNKEPSVASQRKRSSGQVCSRKCRQQEQSDLFMSLIYGFPQRSTWMQLAGSCTSQGRLGTPRCHRLHVIFKLAVARHQSARHYFLRRDTIFAVLSVVTEITAHFPAGMQPSQPVVCADRVASPRFCM